MSAPIVPTAHQFQLAMSKVRLNESQRIVLGYLAAHSVCHPDEDVQAGGIVQVSAETIASETGLNKGTVWRVLSGFPARGDKGLVGRKIVRRWQRGHSGLEAAYSINGHFNEWEVSWGQVESFKADRKAAEEARRAVLLELQGADFVARHRAAKPDYFAARARGEMGVREHVAVRRVVRKRAVTFRALSRGENSDTQPRERAANVVQLRRRSPSYGSTTSPSQEEKREAPPRIRVTPAAEAVLAAIAEVSGHALFGRWKDDVVAALGDTADAGYIVDAIRRGRPNRPEAHELVLLLAKTGPPAALAPIRAECATCGGGGWAQDDETGDVFRCPECVPEEQRL